MMINLYCYQCWIDGLYEVQNPASWIVDGRALCFRHAKEARERMLDGSRSDDG